MAAEPRWTAGNHPTPQELLLAREDELPREEAEPIVAHIHQCWQCRAQVERYKRGIDAYLKFRETRLDPAAAPAAGGWLRLAARLRSAGADAVSGSAGVRRRVPRAVWLALPVAAAALAAVVFLAVPARLTANVVFDRAIRAEAAEGSAVSRQRVLVRRGGRLLAVDDVVLRQAHIEPSRPLSADSFRAWHDSLISKTDAVTTVDNEIRVETTTREGLIALARLEVTRFDYRPRAKHVELRDGITIDVEAVAAETPAPDEAEPAAAVRAAPPEAGTASTTAAEREALEMEVRWALRRIDADLGEPVEIQHSGDRLVVSGTLDEAGRKDQIEEALRGFPQVKAELSVAEADADLLARAQPIDAGRADAGPLLMPRLVQDLPDAEIRGTFVAGALGDAHEMLRHSWALRRLAERYPPASEAALNAEVRSSLRQLVAAHQDAIRAAATEAAARWKPYAALETPPGTARTGWQEAAPRALASAQGLDHCTLRLLAAGGADGLTVGEALQQLRADHRQLLSLLPRESP
jgi:hypothetical protein